MNNNKKILSAITALTITASAFAGFAIPANAQQQTDGMLDSSNVTLLPDSQNNSVNINESFDGETPVNGENFAWDVTTVEAWDKPNKGFSLTANDGKKILTMQNGVGGIMKDIALSFKTGTVKGFEQENATWEMVFKSVNDEELFKVRFVSGGWNRTLSLVTNNEVKTANYSFTDSAYTNVNMNISFGSNGGVVTLGDVSSEFAVGADLGSIEVTYDKVSDWNRPFIVDDFKMSTVDKQKVSLNISSSNTEESVEGAVLTIGSDEYTVPASGVVEVYYLPGEYDYSLKLAKHKAVEGTLTVSEGEGTPKDVYIFNDIPEGIEKATLVEATYTVTAVPTLSSVNTSDVNITDGTYSMEVPKDETGVSTTYMLWDSLEGMKPLSVAEKTTITDSNDKNIVLEYVGEAVPSKIEISGGEEYIYLPTSGTTESSEQFIATVYDNADLVMDNAEIEWSLPGQPDSISIEDGIVTITPDYPLTDDNGVDVTVIATVKGTNVTAETTLHIHNTARATTWDIVGPAVIKDGTTAEFTVENVKDQYGNPFTGENEYTMTSSNPDDTVSELSITPNVGTSRTEDITITVSSNTDLSKKSERTVTVYGYDYYEPGTVQATYGEPRMEVVNDVNSVVWPKSLASKATTTITLPTPVDLTPGSAKMITFDNISTVKTVGSQERSLTFSNSEGEAVISIDFAGTSVVKDFSKVDGNYTGTEIGKLNALNVPSSAIFVLKTNAEGITSAVLSYNGSTLQEYEIGEVGDIASYSLTGGQGAPDERLLTLTNLVISDSDVPEVEIIGDDKIAKISGKTATKTFKGSVFSQSEGETFTWSVADEEGSQIDGVTIDQSGVLSVSDAVEAETKAVISYTSSLSTPESPKLATLEVIIKDFANVQSFDIDGPVAVNAGDSVTYKAVNIIDEYGDKVDMPVSFAITEGNEIASVDSSTGVVTTTGTGNYTLSVTVGNPDKTSTQTITAEVAKYSAVGDASGDSVEVDVTQLANYTAETKYLVTTATTDGVFVNQVEATPVDGKITVSTTGADKYEVSPIYYYDNVGNVSEGKTIPLCDGLYDFTFTKSNGTRADIFVNGKMVGQNVDQYGKGRATSGSTYSVKDVNVQGGKAVVTMKDQTSEMDLILVKKAPSIVTRKTHVYIMGDSLVSNYYGSFADDDGDGVPTAGDAQTGWGQVMDKFISSELNVTNLAESGSTAVGMYNGAFPGILQSAQEGDYVIMEAGYNDHSYSSESEMAETIQKIADQCKEAGITLILTTPNFGTGHGTTNSQNVRFGPKVLEVAKANGLLGINLSGLGYAKYQESDKTSEYWSQNFNVYYSGAQQDGLHLSYFGAMNNAEIVAQAIYDAQNNEENTELAETLKGLIINTQAYEMTDSEGQTVTLQVQ